MADISIDVQVDKPTHVLIDRETLGVLVSVAVSADQDLDDGLADGTYEEDAIGGHAGDRVSAAIETAESVLAG
jgi:hypothetical protein